MHLSEMTIQRRSNHLAQSASAFFQSRGLPVERLGAAVKPKFPEARALLMTSSPVQGLATETSDIDLIAITPETQGGMATQIHVEGHHAEVALLADPALTTCFDDLKAAARVPLRETIGLMREWDVGQPVKKKYLERVINGVAFDGSVPHSHMFAPLAQTFAAQAYGRMIDALAALDLTLATEETRAPWAYAMAVCDHAMDVILCRAGFVYQNRKWIGARWRLHGEEALAAQPSLGDCSQIGNDALAAMRALETPPEAGLVERIHRAAEQISQVMGCGPRIGLRRGAGVEWRRLGRGAGVVLGGHRSILIQKPDGLPDWIALEEARRTSAKQYLSALRAGLMSAEIPA